MKKVLFLFFILLAMTGCPKEEINEEIYLINKSNSEIFVCLGLQDVNKVCPSNLLPSMKSGLLLEKGEKKKIGISHYIPSCDSVKIFVLSADTVLAYTWEEIRETNNILKKYDLTFSDIKKMNWTITYP